MSELTRRGMFTAVAGAASLTVAGTAIAAGDAPTNAARAEGGPPDALIAAARDVVARNLPASHPNARNAWSRVVMCRSWDRRVYLYVSDAVHGFVTVDDRAFAIAASAQASGRSVAVHYWGHEPEWSEVGSFEGALLAFDLRDLPITD